MGNLAKWLINEEITMYRSTATAFRHFIDSLTGDEEFPSLRAIKLGSETVNKRDIELYKKHFSLDCVLYIGLGTTETGTIAHYLVDHTTEIATSTVPVGYPAEDMEIWCIDDEKRQVDCQSVGEIAIKSRYLSTGYWQRPDLTQAAFLPDPSGGDERIYLTGDLGRMLPDGCLEHLGRKDFQLKVRGYRVELAEIEMALLNLDNIVEAVVVAQAGPPGEPQLVAYVSPASQPAPTVTALRRGLMEALPSYMIPSSFVILNTLPMLPNGKVDRRSLPAPGSGRPELENPFILPRTPVEEALAEIWIEVLGLDEVGIADNFLELGGDSLLASQVISRVIIAFRVNLPLRSLFDAPTVADMAVSITQSQAKGAKPEDIERLLAELEALSAEQAEGLLAEESAGA